MRWVCFVAFACLVQRSSCECDQFCECVEGNSSLGSSTFHSDELTQFLCHLIINSSAPPTPPGQICQFSWNCAYSYSLRKDIEFGFSEFSSFLASCIFFLVMFWGVCQSVIYRRLFGRFLNERELFGPTDNKDLSSYTSMAEEYYDRLPHFDEVQVESVTYQCIISQWFLWLFGCGSVVLGCLIAWVRTGANLDDLVSSMVWSELVEPTARSQINSALLLPMALFPVVAIRAKYIETRIDGRTAMALFKDGFISYTWSIIESVEKPLQGIAVASMFLLHTKAEANRTMMIWNTGLTRRWSLVLAVVGGRLWAVCVLYLMLCHTFQRGLILHLFYRQQHDGFVDKLGPAFICKFAGFTGLCNRLLMRLCIEADPPVSLWKATLTVELLITLVRPLLLTFPFLFLYTSFLQARSDANGDILSIVVVGVSCLSLIRNSALALVAIYETFADLRQRRKRKESSTLLKVERVNTERCVGWERLTTVFMGIFVLILVLWVIVRTVMINYCPSHVFFVYGIGRGRFGGCVPFNFPSTSQSL